MAKEKEEQSEAMVVMNKQRNALAAIFGAQPEEIPMVSPDSYAAFKPVAAAQLRVKAGNLGGTKLDEYKLPAIKSPSGPTPFFTVGDQPKKTVRGIVLSMTPNKKYYKLKNSAEKGPPQCSSRDMQYGIGNPDGANPDDPIHPDGGGDGRHLCSMCPWNQFKTGFDGGAGKRCKDGDMVLLLMEGEVMPYVVNIPPSALREWGEYKASLTAPFMLAVLEISLVTDKASGGNEYSRMTFKQVGVLPLEIVERVRNYAKALSMVVDGISAEAYDDTVEIVKLLAAPAA